MTKITHSSFILLIVLLCSCAKDEQPPVSIYPIDEDVILNDVSYGQDSKQQMNVYLPKNRNSKSSKFMVLIHGGAWSTGDKDEFGLLDETAFSLLKSQFPDFAFFNLNYRLVEGDNNTYPAAENDIKLAMEHIYRNLESYQLSAATYVLGVSAGAHLGALYTLKSNNSNIKGCIALAGPYDLVSLYNTSDDFAKSYIKSFMGGTPTQKPALYQEASPINFVSSNSPKFFLVHGTEDELVPIAQAETFKAALESKNVSTTYLTYAGGHDYVPTGSLLETFLRLQIFLK